MGKKKHKHKHKNNYQQQAQQTTSQSSTSMTHQPKKPEWGTGKKQSSKRRVWGIALFVVIVIALALGLTLSGNEEKKAERQAAREERQAKREARKLLKEAEEEYKEAMDGVATRSMEPVVDGVFTYQFEGLDWQFESADEEGVGVPLTRVNMMFENFKRYDEGAYATFGNPYKFGIYEGDCKEVERLEFNTNVETGIPLGFVLCEWQDVATEIVLFQEGEQVVLKSRKTNTDDDAFKTITSIDLKTVVE